MGKERAAQHLKEVYSLKEDIDLKTQRVLALETAMNEIEECEKETKKELSRVMDDIQKVQRKKWKEAAKKKDDLAGLIEKLENLEVATKDLVSKEKLTKVQLGKSLSE